MADRNGIASGGNWIIDHVKVIDVYPKEDHLAMIQNESYGTGGAPYNVLAGLRALDAGMPLQAIGVVGDDANGRFILDHIARLGIDGTQMRTTGERPTSYTDVMTAAATGRRTFFHNRGANALLCESDFRLDEMKAKIFHLGYLMLLDALDRPDPDDSTRTCGAKVLDSAQRAGMKSSLDIVTDLGPNLKTMVAPALKYVDYFIANELEAGALAEVPLRADDGKLLTQNFPLVAEKLFAAGVKELIVVHMPEGGYWKSAGGEELLQPSLKLPQEWIKGTAGAGDAFCGGILYGLHEGWDARRCLELAVSHAAMSLTDPTCTAGLKPLAETNGLMTRFGVRDFSS